MRETGKTKEAAKAGDRRGIKEREKAAGIIFIIILAFYPLRHITWGLDLWDTGYNYANFQYMGLEHMDSMWLFSTYFANVLGNLLTKLPFADGLAGMNFYTGLFVSFLAVAGYVFCAKKLGVSPLMAFLGEMVAVSLCWCPTALLYNYLTYVLFLACVCFLYEGLTGQKRGYLAAAGICLGTNVFVRFSNLPEAAMILAVWAYAVIDGREKGQKKQQIIRRTALDTLWCFLGYVASLAVFLGYIHVRYGLDAYTEGIRRLFAMTDNAADYKASSMIMGLVTIYTENLYWVVRIGMIAAVGLIFFGMLHFSTERLDIIKRNPRLSSFLKASGRVLWALAAAAMLGWLYYRGFCSLQFYSYDSILRPGVLFLMLAMFIGAVRIFHRSCSPREKLISGMLILMVLLTSIGSNNGVYPSLNNLFLAAPYTFWQCGRFIKSHSVIRRKQLVISTEPLKWLLGAFLAMFLFQTLLFGVCFVFAEATGVRDVSARVDNNEVLRGIRMSPERAEWMSSVTSYVQENGLQGREVILYGQIPALSYYLQMPSAFNPWPDLRSYGAEVMKQALSEVEGRPVIIMEREYAGYIEEGNQGLVDLGLTEKRIGEIEGDEKLELLMEYMEENGYQRTFSNEKFSIWE